MPRQPLKIKIPKLSLNTILTLVFLIIILVEGYFGYQDLYLNLVNNELPLVSTGNIVRLDTQSYKTIIDLLNRLQTYSPSNPVPANTNPFK
jgi:hypothetical protein